MTKETIGPAENAARPISEQDFAERTGITRDTLRELRKELLEEGTHWQKSHRVIMLTPAGQAVLATVLIDEVPVESPAEKTPADSLCESTASVVPVDPVKAVDGEPSSVDGEKKPPLTLSLRVARVFDKNPKWLTAEIVDQPEHDPVRVRVRSNENFVRGMTFKAQLQNNGTWSMLGRCPRYRGKW
ncbi:MAG: hypothetical protein AAFX93_19595 [Verrucomicrobiota bacterium]